MIGGKFPFLEILNPRWNPKPLLSASIAAVKSVANQANKNVNRLLKSWSDVEADFTALCIALSATTQTE